MQIKSTRSGLIREPLSAPFGFKGSYLTELWQSVASVSAGEYRGLGVGVQSVLWSDAEIFAAYSQEAGNRLMLDMSRHALKLLEGRRLEHPQQLLHELLPEVYHYGQERTGKRDLRMTFALNSLVPVDNALWQLWARVQGREQLMELIPESQRPPLGFRHEALGCIPLISYATSLDEVRRLAVEGAFLLKIKIGSDPERDGDREKMLRWDMERLSRIHETVGELSTPYTHSGRILYYLDANGRYDCPDRLWRLIEHAERIGALERIALLEEPFPEDCGLDVSAFPLRLAADESAHSDKDALRLIEQGYSAIALKPVAKTLSMSLKILELAHAAGIPCFCADLTVNPWLCEFNKFVAARIAPLPGLKVGVVESNGAQNYKNWNKMCALHPLWGKSGSILPREALYRLDEDFYCHQGGILMDAPGYAAALD